jgi:predicted deacylase
MSLPELAAIDRLASAPAPGVAVDILAHVDTLPIHAFRFGPRDALKPALLVVGGVHGLERIGTDVAIAYLTTLHARLAWDRVLHDALERCRVIVVPLLNPVGMSRGQRANGNGVDLMRNAPGTDGDARDANTTPLLGGQRISPRLPWYMGRADAMEPEAAALVSLVEVELFASPFSIAVDLHSGFGFVDRLWYPYARTREPLADLPAITALERLLDDTLPNHVYRVEQTAQAYTIRGDLWDHLYDRRRAVGTGRMLPLTLEMGSWAWVRKSPLQGLSSLGRFNPMKPHRLARTLRRHLPLLDFLHHAAASHATWAPS